MSKAKQDDSTLQPRLYFPNFNGGFIKEYIPGTYKKSTKKIVFWYNILRNKLGLNLYYWHMRDIYPPLDRKIKDLEFIQHVIEQHDGKPKLLMEKVHFNIAWSLYGREYNYIQQTEKDEELLKESTKDVYYQKHPYVVAYKKRWRSYAKDDSEWTTLYHGLKLREMEFFFDILEQKDKDRMKLREKIYKIKS